MAFHALATALLLAGVQTTPENAPPGNQAYPVDQPAKADPAAPLAVQAEAPKAPVAAEVDQAKQSAAVPASDAASNQDAIVVTARRGATPGDPFEEVNQKFFAVTQSVDKAVFGPVAMAYKHSLPNPVRSGIRNVLRNLDQPVIFLNYLLQFKPGKAAEAVGRFAVNSTVGLAGLFDVAKKKPFNLPYRYNGFANTMGYHGIGTGPFLYIPFIGATSLRDAIGDGLDRLVLPLSIGKPFNRLYYFVPTTALRQIDRRAELDDRIQELRSGTGNPYVKTRELYMKARQDDIDALHSKRYRERHKREVEATQPQPPAAPPPQPSAPPPDKSQVVEPQPATVQPSPQF